MSQEHRVSNGVNQEKLTKILSNIIKTGIFIILFLPLVISSDFFFPFVVFRNILFRVIVEIIFVIYLVLAVNDQNYRPNFKNKLFSAVIFFFSVLFLASLFGVDFKNSIWGNYERMNGLFHSFHLMLFFIVLSNVFKDRKDWCQLFTFSIFSSLLMSFISLAQYFQIPFLLKSSGSTRLTGTVGNATYLAAYFIFNLFLIYYFFLKEKKFSLNLFFYSLLGFDIILIIYEFSIKTPGILSQTLKYPKVALPFLFFHIFIIALYFIKNNQKLFLRIFLVLLFIFEFFIFFNTQTRGAVLGLLAGVLFYVAVKIILGQRKEKIIAISVVVLIVIFSLFVYLNRNSVWLQKNVPTIYRLTTISPKSLTGESRLLTWRASFKGMIERPILGYGLENYNVVFNKYFPSKIYQDAGSQIWFDKAHNIIFDVGVTSGFVGLFSYLAIFIFAFYYLIKIYQNNKDLNGNLLFAALLIAYFGQNIFVFDTLNTEILFYLILGFIVFKSEAISASKYFKEPRHDLEFNFLTPIILLIIFLFVFYNFNYKPTKGNLALTQALYARSAKEQLGQSIYGEEIVDYFKKALFYSQNTVGKFETRQQLALYAMDLSRDERADQSKVKSVIEFAVSELEKSVAEGPSNAREYLFLATLYNATAKFNFNYVNKSINLLTEAIPLSPTRPQLYFERGQSKIFLGDLSGAIEDFKKGVEYSPTVIESHWNLATVYILASQDKLAEEEFAVLKKLGFNFNTVSSYRRLIQIYTNKQNYSKVAEMMRQIIKLEPNTADNYVKLAQVYATMGDKKKARETIGQAVKIDPKFKEQADLFLEELKSK